MLRKAHGCGLPIGLLLLALPFTVSGQWRINAVTAEVDALRFNTPEAAHDYLQSYWLNEYPSHGYLNDSLYPSTSYGDGRLVSWVCLAETAADAVFDAEKCASDPPGYTLPKSRFILTAELSESPFLDRDLGRPSTTMCVGNPIHLGTGNKFQEEIDYRGAGPEPLTFARYYNSQAAQEAAALGGWTHTYAYRVHVDPDRYGSQMVVLERPQGERLAFYRATESWKPTWTTNARLIERSSGWRYERTDGVAEEYASDGKLKAIYWPSGNVHRLTYSNGVIASVSDSYGRTLSFQQRNGRISAVVDPAGSITQYQYAQNRLSEVERPDGSVRTYLYDDPDAPGLLTGIIDERGTRFATWDYDSEGRAILSEHAHGAERTTVRYNADGTVTVTNALGHEQHYTFSRRNGKLKPDTVEGAPCMGFTGGTETYLYDSNGYLQSITDREGQRRNFSYNSRGLETSRTSNDGGQITTEWHPDFAKPVKITEPTRIIEYTYDSRQRVLSRMISERNGSGIRTWTYTYHPDKDGVPGQLATIDGPRTGALDVTSFDYDDQGNLVRVTDALGHVTVFSQHDAHGRPQRIADPNGVIRELAHDVRGRLVSSTGPEGATTYTHNAVGLITEAELPNGVEFTFEYDNAQRLIAVVDQQGNRRLLERDDLGNVIEERVLDAAAVTHWHEQRVYNEIGWLMAITDAQGYATTFSYDRVKNLTSESDALGDTYSHTYDGFHHRTRTLDPNGQLTEFRYESTGDLSRVRDTRSRSTYYYYNGFGELARMQSPDTGVTEYTYDEAGNVITRKDARGQVTTYSYDALNRLTRISTDSPAEHDTVLAYDAADAAFGVGRLTSVTDSTGVTRYDYTASGEIARVTRATGGQSHAVEYTYDGAGQVSSITYPSGRKVHYWRDTAGQIVSVTQTLNGSLTTLASQIARKPFGPITRLVHGNGLVESRVYDQSYRVTEISIPGVLERSYTYTPDGNVASIDHLLSISAGQSFDYDALDRLIGADGLYGVLGYEYDHNSNRTARIENGTRDRYTVNFSNNWLLRTGSGAIQYAYDANGNTISRGGDTFVYDTHNRLIEATVGGTTATYAYNHLHQRVSKTIGGQTTLYFYGLDGELLAEVDATTGQTVREYIWLDGAPLAYVTDGTTYHVHVDHLGTPQALTGSAGGIAWRGDYAPFGAASTSNSLTFNLRFPGQYFDAETGLHYNWYRYYDPSTGRYITSDPIGLAGGLNTYAYVDGNPLRLSDPTGQCPWCIVGAGLGAALNIYGQYRDNGDFDNFSWGSLAASTAAGALGGGLGTLTARVSTQIGWLIGSNAAGNAAIGAAVTATRNQLSDRCDSVTDAAINGAIVGGIGAGFAGGTSRIISALNRVHYESLPTATKTFFGSNALHGVKQPELIRGGTAVSDALGNTVGNLSVYNASGSCVCQGAVQ